MDAHTVSTMCALDAVGRAGLGRFAVPAQASGWEHWQRAVLRKELCSLLPAGSLVPPPHMAELTFSVFSVMCPVGEHRCQHQAPHPSPPPSTHLRK